MKLFAVRGEGTALADLAYLLYYEKERRFYIELPEEADPWETPLLLSSFLKRGQRTVDSYWSRLWVQQRIIPPDRQNLGQILKDNGLQEYDEYQLLLLTGGRCVQDDYYLAPLREEQLPPAIRQRFQLHVEEAVPLEDASLLVFFRDGSVRKCPLGPYFRQHGRFRILLERKEVFYDVRLQPGGYGVEWDVGLGIAAPELYARGRKVPLSVAALRNFIACSMVNVAEAAELLGCSRQNIAYLTKAGKLHPLKASEKDRLYLKSEVLRRSWQ